jgi:hypothetical protein
MVLTSPEAYGLDLSRDELIAVPGGKKPATMANVSDLKLYGTNIVPSGTNTSTLLGANGKPITAEGQTLLDPSKPLAAANYLTPEEQEQARQVQQVAGAINAAAPPEKSWISNLFDTSDTFDENGNFKSDDLALVGGEAAFDGFLRGLQWGFDRINQYTVAATSALPGGTRTLTFDEANDVSFGQMLVANAGISMGRIRRGEGNVGDALALSFGILPGIGAAVAGYVDPDTPVQQREFDITNPKDREVFNNGAERIFSGTGDFGFAFADPTFFVGWGAKIARLRYVDRIIDSEVKLQRAVDEVSEGQRLMQNNLPVGATIERDLTDEMANSIQMAPVAMFLRDTVKQNVDGSKSVSYEKIYNHKVIRYAANRDALTTALYNAQTYDEAALILRHAWGDKNALPELLNSRPDILAELIDAERELIRQTLVSDPKKAADMIAEYQSKIDRYDRDLAFLRANAADDPQLMEKIDFVLNKKNQELEKWLNVNDGVVPRTPTAADIELTKRNIELLQQKNVAAARVIQEASVATGSLRQSVKGFSANNRFGRAVERSRQRRAQAQYETETTRGAKLWEPTDFSYLNTGKGRATRVLRVWRYLGAEAPSGIVRVAGAGAQESVREVRAMLNSIRAYGGKGKQITDADGNVTIVGGSLNKEKMLTEYANALAEGTVAGQDAAATALRKIEQQIEKDMGLFYQIEGNGLSEALSITNGKRQQLKKDIIDNGFYVDPAFPKVEHKVPYLESQLQGSEIMMNWRAVENVILRETKRTKSLREFGTKVAIDNYAIFQDIWRPAVLLRLGYTQRNVAEGLFRSAAFQFSLAPLGLAAKQFSMSTGNTIRAAKYGRQGTRGVLERATVAAREGATLDRMPKAYQKWHNAQIDEIDNQINHNVRVMDLAIRELASESNTWKVAEQGRLRTRLNSLQAQREELVDNPPAGLTQDQIDSQIARIDLISGDAERRFALLDNIVGGSNEAIPDNLATAADNLLYFDDMIMPMLFAQRELMTNMRTSVLMYREQTLAKRRLYQGQANVTDPETLKATFMAYSTRGAFDPNDSFTNIALANLSADHTTRQVLALRVNTAESILRNQVVKAFVAVSPGEAGYWDGLATTFNQWKQSDVGEIIIREIAEGRKTDDEIAASVAAFLRTDERGREIAAFLTDANKSEVGQKSGFVEYGKRVAAASELAVKSTLPERQAADEAKDAIAKARADVAWAKKKLKQDQKTKPSRTALIGPDGQRIADPVKYVEKRRAAYAKAEKAYQEKFDRLSQPADLPKIAGTDGAKFESFGPNMSIEDALAYATSQVQRYRQFTANNPDLQRLLFARGSLTTSDKDPLAKFAADLEELLGPNSRNANGDPYQLVPVIGNAAIDLGANSVMEAIRTASNAAFRVLGTIPEDTFVRAPFYGRRFEKTYKDLERAYLAQTPGDTLKSSEINAIRQAAHQRALKDTKDWLYTIDRRTLLGQYGEAVFPFISASQNSLSAVGRIIWNDPRVLAGMIMIWNAPTRAGLEDEEGRIRFSMPLQWVPEGVRDALGLGAMLDFNFSKQQANLIAPPTGFGGALPVPVPGPVVSIPISELMKREWLGIGPAAPDLLSGVLGQETADQVWEVAKSWVFGSDQDITGMSTLPLSIDRAAPPWFQKLTQWMQGEGTSSAYTSWYDKIYQSEYLKWEQGYRDEPPTPQEISDSTRNFYFFRMAMNFVAFSPPGFTSEITPVVDAARRIYEAEPNSEIANMKIYEKFGGPVQQLLRIRSTEAVAGLDATAESYRLVKNHSDLIGAVAPILERNDTLSVIGILSGSSNGDYDPSFSAAQQLAKIPNTNRAFREVANPARQFVDSQISAGWAQYLRNMDVINAKLAERGLKSLQSRGAENLRDMRDAMIESLRRDPRFTAWYGDYKSGVSSRTLDSVATIEAALGNQKWRDANEENPIWGYGGAAEQYMYARQQTIEALDTTSNPEQRAEIKAQWQAFRFDLGMRFPDWGAKQDRYLTGDDNPEDPQIIITGNAPIINRMTEMADAAQSAAIPSGAPYQYGGQ